ncbi:very short patch repair endonuclease [Falsiruegeria mediterranea]
MDIVSPEKRSWMMSRISGANTKPELLVRRGLHCQGFRFRLHRRDLPGTPDIVLPKYKAVIFVHGCYWHRHPNCKYATTPSTNKEKWQMKFAENVVRDRKNHQLLLDSGWRVAVIWECALKQSTHPVLERTSSWLKSQTSCLEIG